jgi:APA family basic amino acid/polyamine antiporter
MIVAGSMIGSGIFIVSADIARQVGSPGWLIMIWVATGLLTVFAALSYGELAALFPDAGGQYVYLREAYSPLWGFLYGWTLFAVIQTGSIAAVAVAFAKFMGIIFPAVSAENTLFSIGTIPFSTQRIVAILLIALLTAVNTIGLKTGKTVQNIFTLTKIGSLVVLIILAFFIVQNGSSAIHTSNFWQPVVNGGILPVMGLIVAFGTAMVGSLFASDAWNNIGFASEEVKNPRRTIALSMTYGTILVSVIYVIVNYSYIAVLPMEAIQNAAEDRVGIAAAETIFGGSAALIMAVAVMISTFGCENGMILTGARVYYAMAQDKLFFKRIGELNSAGVPANGLILQGIWSALLTLSGTYGDLLDYVIFASLLFYILTIIGIFVLRRKRPQIVRTYKAWGYPVVPLLYVIFAGLIMIDLLIYKPTYTWPGLGLALTGLPVYYLWKRKA